MTAVQKVLVSGSAGFIGGYVVAIPWITDAVANGTL